MATHKRKFKYIIEARDKDHKSWYETVAEITFSWKNARQSLKAYNQKFPKEKGEERRIKQHKILTQKEWCKKMLKEFEALKINETMYWKPYMITYDITRISTFKYEISHTSEDYNVATCTRQTAREIIAQGRDGYFDETRKSAFHKLRWD